MSFIMYTNLLVLTTSYLIFIIFHFSVGSSLHTTIFELLKSLKVNQSKKDTNRENPNFEFFFWTQIFVYPPKIILYYIFILDFNHSNIKNENAKEKWQLLIEPWFLPGVCFWNARRIEDLGSSRGGQAKFLTHEVGKVMIELYICPLHLSKLKGKTLKSELKKNVLHRMAHFHNTGKILVSHSKSSILGLYQAFFGQINPR